MRNPLLSKRLTQATRLLIIDDNQIRFNQIIDLFKHHEHQVHSILLDDYNSFEKQLKQTWDMIIFGRAYDLKIEQALSLIHTTAQHQLPVLLLQPDDYQKFEYSCYINQGVYEVINLAEPEHFYFSLGRALALSQAQQSQNQLLNQLTTVQQQAHTLVEGINRPIAIIQEGIHLEANPEYLNLFGFKSVDDLIGLPLLDVLQPKDTHGFKARFKKVSQGQLDSGRFAIQSTHPSITTDTSLNLEFLPAPDYEDALQLSIDQGEFHGVLTPHTAQSEVTAIVQTTAPYQHINHCLQQQPTLFNALVLFSLNTLPSEVFEPTWHNPQDYFLCMQDFLTEQTHASIFAIEPWVYVSVLQAESKEKLELKLMGLTSLLKPQLLAVGQQSYPLNLNIGYRMLEGELENQVHLQQMMSDAFAQPLFNNSGELSVKLNLEQAPQAELSLLDTLQQHFTAGKIQLKYQQLYDKQDSDLHIYEVTSGFIYQNRWISLENLSDLDELPELSIQLDRWILVEACKQLHNFITQYPKAKLIVNLNKHVLIEDTSLPELIRKLLSMIKSKESQPLWLQFSEQDLHTHFAKAQKQTALLHEQGAAISARDFGYSMYSESILKQIELSHLTLHTDLSLALYNETQTLELQQRLQEFYEIKHVDVLLRGLDDMTLFANAWNLDVRFIQGDYFQKKLDHLIAVDE